MPYEYYLLRRTNANRTNASTLRLCKKLKSPELTFRERNYTGEDHFIIFDFLNRLVEEADTLDISEVQMMVLIPHLIKDAGEQYRTSTNGALTGTSGGIVHWPGTVQYLLSTYGTVTTIGKSMTSVNYVNR